jgi:protoporphyrinogen oxidase
VAATEGRVRETDVLIVGAGMSGLATANFLPEGTDFLVLEADREPGGYCKTVHQDGFVWDYSGHFFHFREPAVEAFLRARMPADEVLRVNKRSAIRIGGRRIDFPFQKNIHQLPLDDFLDCLHDLHFRAGSAAAAGVAEASFLGMLYARFGRGITERFLRPYNEKLYATPLDRLDRDAMGRFFPQGDVDDIFRHFKHPDNSSYNGTFSYPRGGAIEYVRALLRDLPAERVALGERVEAVDLAAKEAHTSAGTVRFGRLVSSAPLPQLLRACALPHDAGCFGWNKVLVFNLGFDAKGAEQDHWVYFPERDLVFYRVGYYDNIFATPRMSLYVEIGLGRHDEVDVAAALERVLVDLRRAGVVEGQRLVSWHSVVLDPAYVHIDRASQAEVARCRGVLAERDVYSIGRYGGWTYCSIEDNLLEARALVQRWTGALPPLDRPPRARPG